MKVKLNIGKKLWIGFGVLLTAIVLNGLLSYITFVKIQAYNQEVSGSVTPSILELKELQNIIGQSDKLILFWLDNSTEDSPQKIQLTRIHNGYYPNLNKQLKRMSGLWSSTQKERMDSVLSSSDRLIGHQHSVMIRFDEPESYQDPQNMESLKQDRQSFENGELYELSQALLSDIQELLLNQRMKLDTLNSKIDDSFGNFQNYIFLLSLFLLFFSVMVAYSITASIVKPISRLRDLLRTMGQGVLPNVEHMDRQDEIGEMNKALTNLITGLKSIVKFSKSIGSGDFDTQFKPLSSQDDLGINLLTMRDNLRQISEEDRRRNWATGGLAQFGELLRESSDNVTELTEKLIAELVAYLEANQGGVFVLDATQKIPYMELKACYAWDRQKFLNQKIFEGDGLVGQCWIEQDTLYITDVPQDYVKITSGLGQALPKSILLVPMVSNGEVFGVIELASFKAFEPFEVAFVKRLAESTAATIASAKVNEQTKKLLEQTQINADQLEIHERQMVSQQAQMTKNQQQLDAEITFLKAQVKELTFKNESLKEENSIQMVLVQKLNQQKDAQ